MALETSSHKGSSHLDDEIHDSLSDTDCGTYFSCSQRSLLSSPSFHDLQDINEEDDSDDDKERIDDEIAPSSIDVAIFPDSVPRIPLGRHEIVNPETTSDKKNQSNGPDRRMLSPRKKMHKPSSSTAFPPPSPTRKTALLIPLPHIERPNSKRSLKSFCCDKAPRYPLRSTSSRSVGL